MEPSQNNREIGWSDSSDSEAWIDDEEMGEIGRASCRERV